ncbi:hypothetical protein SK128_020644 [Halocaridina rubra]|uniref:Uncharacterized protein n=1 Tax=Halocaridina rubra TaxID=373956 RepID=A0AAN8WRQ7_HALRR
MMNVLVTEMTKHRATSGFMTKGTSLFNGYTQQYVVDEEEGRGGSTRGNLMPWALLPSLHIYKNTINFRPLRRTRRR